VKQSSIWNHNLIANTIFSHVRNLQNTFQQGVDISRKKLFEN